MAIHDDECSSLIITVVPPMVVDEDVYRAINVMLVFNVTILVRLVSPSLHLSQKYVTSSIVKVSGIT